jgi:bifunctional non-homologous end joining protein LigD
MSLARYRAKRNFKKTAEPSPAMRKNAGKKLPIFVVQKHRASHLHYDFRLAAKGVLKSWAVPKGPPRRAGDRRLAVMVEDHPYAYKDFEGRIPEGQYGAGTVEIWDRGTYEPMGSLTSGLRRGHATFILHGTKLKGEYALVSLQQSKKNWLLIKVKKKKP